MKGKTMKTPKVTLTEAELKVDRELFAVEAVKVERLYGETNEIKVTIVAKEKVDNG